MKVIISTCVMLAAVSLFCRCGPVSGVPRGAALPADGHEVLRTAVVVPAGRYHLGSREPGCYPARIVELSAFMIWPCEVPRSWWRVFAGQEDGGGVTADAFAPAASVSFADAETFCRWFSDRYAVAARLPTVDEWEAAARAGKNGTPYPWGWASPEGRSAFRGTGVASVVSFAPNPWGLFNMSGNVAEWCARGEGERVAPVMGGSWAERDPDYVRISHRLMLPAEYRDEDVGFRIVIEIPPEKETVALTTSNRE